MESSDISAASIARQLNDVLAHFDISNNDGEIIANNGKTYKVANVLEEKDGSWNVTEMRTRGMFSCKYCGGDDPFNSLLPGSSWTQIRQGDKVVRLHDSLLHLFKEHLTEVPLNSLQSVADVLFG